MHLQKNAVSSPEHEYDSIEEDDDDDSDILPGDNESDDAKNQN